MLQDITMSDLTWFQHCEIYLDRLKALDAYFVLCDTLPTNEKEQKRLAFEGLMRVMKQKKDIEMDLEELWGLNKP